LMPFNVAAFRLASRNRRLQRASRGKAYLL
jgi:hypothetical protein